MTPLNSAPGKGSEPKHPPMDSQKRTFCNIARMSSISALHRLQDKPFMSKELAFKLQEDVDSGVLIKFSDFLN